MSSTVPGEGHPDNLTDLLSRWRVVPVVALDDPRLAPPLADALGAGGIGCLEITFRTSAAAEAIASVAGRADLVVGAGTVTTPAQVELAVQAGARFAVSPGFEDSVVSRCAELGLPLLPGIATASELMRACNASLRTVKFFPAEPLGGLAMLAALAAPFPDVVFIPTGGITRQLAVSYLAHPAVAAVGGSWMVPRDAIRRGDWDAIQAESRATLDAIAAEEGTRE